MTDRDDDRDVYFGRAYRDEQNLRRAKSSSNLGMIAMAVIAVLVALATLATKMGWIG